MTLFSLSLGILLLALAVVATPLAPHGSLRRRPWKTRDAHNFLPSNKARAPNVIARDSSTKTYNAATFDTKAIHCIPVGIGMPPTTCACNSWHAYICDVNFDANPDNLIVDTGR